MKNDEVKEIFDEVDGDLCAREWDVENKDFQTPTEYLAFIIERLEVTREFFKDWRATKKL